MEVTYYVVYYYTVSQIPKQKEIRININFKLFTAFRQHKPFNFQEDLHTEVFIKDEHFDLQSEESVAYCTEGLPAADCSTVKHQTSGADHSPDLQNQSKTKHSDRKNSCYQCCYSTRKKEAYATHILFNKCAEGVSVADSSTPKQGTPGVEESAVIVVEGTTAGEESQEQNTDTADPLSLHSSEGKLVKGFVLYFYFIKNAFD